MPFEAGCCVWEVTAGLIPGTVDPEYTRGFGLTSQEWEGSEGLLLFLRRGAEANAYAGYLQLLCSQGRAVNWTRVDLVWF